MGADRAGGLPHGLVAAVNGLTARWCAEAPVHDAGFVVSGAGVWPLLALLASGARGPAAAELVAATGRPADGAHADALAVIDTLSSAAGTEAAIGLWVSDTVPLIEAWTDAAPSGTIGRLTGTADDAKALDDWCARQTNAQLDRFPGVVDASTLLLLANAVMARTRWRAPFRHGSQRGNDAWAGRWIPCLWRASADVDSVAVLAGPAITRVVVEGDNDIDVHLLIGEPGGDRADLFGRGLDGSTPWRPASDLPVGHRAPGLTVTMTRAGNAQDALVIGLPPFSLRSSHQLTATPALFGLTTATTDGDHFPSIATEPLKVQRAQQDALAGFDGEGFEGAAVTAVTLMAGGSGPYTEHERKCVEVLFGHPFGFAAVHRPTGLAVLAGWVAEPPPLPAIEIVDWPRS